MAKLDKMAIIQEKYCSGTKPLAKFLTIYIEECKPHFIDNTIDLFKMIFLFLV